MRTFFILILLSGGVSLQAQYQARQSVLTGGAAAASDSAQYQSVSGIGQLWIGPSQDTAMMSLSGFFYSAGRLVVSVKDDQPVLPEKFALYPNYPNPFNPTTTIRYDLPKPGKVRLVIYNLLGQTVRTLVNTSETAGAKTVRWDGRNDRGASVSSGLYIYRLETGGFVKSRKMLLIK